MEGSLDAALNSTLLAVVATAYAKCGTTLSSI
jgi:hypothetical protein